MFSDPKYKFSVHQKYFFVVQSKFSIFHRIQPTYVTNRYITANHFPQEKLVSESSRRLPEVVQQQFRGCGGARVPRKHAAGARTRVSRADRQLARCHGW